MSEPPAGSGFPRPLRASELDALLFVLPSDRPGYRHYRELVQGMTALAEGRRGSGNLVLGAPDDRADLISPLAPVIAFGVIETEGDRYMVTVREESGRQVDVEIVSSRGEEIPDTILEKRRWTYSTWRPGEPAPGSGAQVRVITVDEMHALAVAPADRRIWIYDGTTGMNHLLPITNFYNALMLHMRVRDPRKALDSSTFFADQAEYADEELRTAFAGYNATRRRVDLRPPVTPSPGRGIRRILMSLVGRKSSNG